MTDWFIRAFGNAVADARTVLIDESWFNRRGSPTAHDLSSPQESRDGPNTERDPLGRTNEPGHGVEPAPDHTFEIDR